MYNKYSGLDVHKRVIMWDGDSYQYVDKENVVSSLMKGLIFDPSGDTGTNIIEECLTAGIKYSFGSLVIGQATMGIISLI